MRKQTVGFVGWRGMVGSVLLDRMEIEKDFDDIEPIFFSTSQKGSFGPEISENRHKLKDAYDIKELSKLDIIVTTQGSEYTKKVYYDLRKNNWKGYWIDSASLLRLDKDSIIALDPVNKDIIFSGLKSQIKTFTGGNCTASLALMSLAGLIKKDLIEWISMMTYQAASGAGSKAVLELLNQMRFINSKVSSFLDLNADITQIDKILNNSLMSDDFPIKIFKTPLATSLIPWIDKYMENGQSKEEWKANVEANKILNKNIPVDGLCVRIGAIRCHSLAFTIKLKKDVPIADIEEIVKSGNKWINFIENNPNSTIKYLSPDKVSGSLNINIGKLRPMIIGKSYITAFSVGDQLLWGAAEPLRRILNIIKNFQC